MKTRFAKMDAEMWKAERLQLHMCIKKYKQFYALLMTCEIIRTQQRFQI